MCDTNSRHIHSGNTSCCTTRDYREEGRHATHTITHSLRQHRPVMGSPIMLHHGVMRLLAVPACSELTGCTTNADLVFRPRQPIRGSREEKCIVL